MRALFAQAAASIGITVPELVIGLGTILAAVVGPLVTALVKISNSKDEALKGQATAHVGERAEWAKSSAARDAEWMKLVAARDAFIERLVDGRARDQQDASDARARDAADARGALVQLSTEAMRVVDAMRGELDVSTPVSPMPRDSRTSVVPALPEPGGPPTARPRGGRRSNA